MKMQCEAANIDNEGSPLDVQEELDADAEGDEMDEDAEGNLDAEGDADAEGEGDADADKTDNVTQGQKEVKDGEEAGE